MSIYYDFDEVIDRRHSFATKFEELSEKYGRVDLFPLWIADMDFATPAPIRDALAVCVSQPVLGYATAPTSFWDSISGWLGRRHGWEVGREHLDFLPGVKKGIGLCVNYFTHPGDGIVIQPPVYHSFRSVIEGNGRVVIDNPLICMNGKYMMDFDALERDIIASKPAMMIVCNPHNPVGVQWSADTLWRVVSICRRHGVILLSDEIYGDMVLAGRHIPTASVSPEAEEITVTIGAPSKSFNIPGISSAWVVVKSPALRDGFFAWLKASEFDTPPTCAIYATMAAYTECDEWLDAVLKYIASNVVAAADFVSRKMPGVKVVAPEAGFGLWLDFRAVGLCHDRLVEMLVDGAGVAVSDGASFGSGGSGFVRVNIGVPRSVMLCGLERIAKALAEWKRL